jgi:hypothetical protein
VGTLETDYLVIGAGACGMAFVDALIAESDADVILVDRRHRPGGHWLDAYPFVRLHQASSFYGVASTLLGSGKVQETGPEAGLQERATAPEICAYYASVLQRMQGSGKVTFFPQHDHVGGGELVSLESGERVRVSRTARLVDARYLSPRIPARTPPPFGVAEGARVVPVNDLPTLGDLPPQVVVVGAGKTASDACLWLLDNGVAPDAICWVRPRDPWMYNRAVVQPDPAVFLGMAADLMTAAAQASSPDDLFLRLEEAGVMLRFDRSVTPTMAKTPTIAQWEIDRLAAIEHVVRLGHVRQVEPGRLVLDGGDVPINRDALVVHCAASGLQYPPLVPIWGPEAITVQPIRTGFPCFGAALSGYAEATLGDDAEKNRFCPPSPYSNTPADWAAMQVLGGRSSLAVGSHADLKEWSSTVALNPARVLPEQEGSPDVAAAAERFKQAVGPGLARLAELGGLA